MATSLKNTINLSGGKQAKSQKNSKTNVPKHFNIFGIISISLMELELLTGSALILYLILKSSIGDH